LKNAEKEKHTLYIFHVETKKYLRLNKPNNYQPQRQNHL